MAHPIQYRGHDIVRQRNGVGRVDTYLVYESGTREIVLVERMTLNAALRAIDAVVDDADEVE
jgi:hypothetical protein